MKYFTLFLFFITACESKVDISTNYNINYNKTKIFVVDGEAYEIKTGSDNHQYYLLEIGMGGQLSSKMPFHYPGCNLCR